MPNSSTMNFQAYLEDAYRIIKAEPVILILGGFIVQLLTILSMGILAGPFMGGYFLLVIHYLRDGRKPTFNDIFAGVQQFGRLFPYFLVLLLILIGFMLLLLPGFLFATWWIYVLPLMVDRQVSYGEAMRLSMTKVNETGFFMHLIFLLLITVIPMMLLNFLSAVIPFLFVLKILLPPFQVGCLASLYLDQFGRDNSVADARQAAETKAIGNGAETDVAAEEAGAPAEAPEEPAEDAAGEDKPAEAQREADQGTPAEAAAEEEKEESRKEKQEES